MAESQPIISPVEEWRDVPDFEGYYEVSSTGQARSLDRVITFPDGRSRRAKGLILSQHIGTHGYPTVNIRKSGVVKVSLVHRLVLEAFVGPCPPGMEACHANGDKKDNRLINLRWDTSSENKYDNVRNGVHHQVLKSNCPRGHLLEAPNLVVSTARKGRRDCLSCARTRGFLRFRKRLNLDFKSISDSYYQDIMGM